MIITVKIHGQGNEAYVGDTYNVRLASDIYHALQVALGQDDLEYAHAIRDHNGNTVGSVKIVRGGK